MSDKKTEAGSHEFCYVDKDGKLSDADLHNAILDGVDDHEFDDDIRKRLLARGETPADIDRMLARY